MKVIIFDSSTIITLALNNLLYLLERLHENFNGKFIITPDVKREIIDKPMQTKRFELEALMITQLFKKGVLEMSESLNIDEKEIKERTSKIMHHANNCFIARGSPIKIISEGEASCIAFGVILQEKREDYSLAIDERTARMLIENPVNLGKLLEKKLHTNIETIKDNVKFFSDIDSRIIRSSEICYIAYKKGVTEIGEGTQVIDAMLYASKFKGCAISAQEIEEIKEIG